MGRKINKNIIGYAEVRIQLNHPTNLFQIKKYLEVECIVVDERFKRQGIGELFYYFIVNFCKSNNIKHIHLSVFRKNNEGYNFWKKFGFRETSFEMIKK